MDIARRLPARMTSAVATRLSVVVDADDYFQLLRSAMLRAKRRIMLVGWDFDGRITLTDGRRLPGEPEAIGEFVLWLVEREPDLNVYLLRWDMGALKAVFRGNTWFTLVKWLRHPRIHVKLDGHHPTGASHHQKIVAIDDCFAFCGGIDVTAKRWDTRVHMDRDPGRLDPAGRPYKPWHDATSALKGPAAAALGTICRTRWQRASGERLDPIDGVTECWPDALDVDFHDVDVEIALTEPEMPDTPAISEIEALFLRHIAGAKRFIYAESQYFASRKIAEAVARRLDEADGPEIVLINPDKADGWLQPLAMDTARARLVEALKRRDRHGRFRIYYPVTSGGDPIYVHAKLLFVDDRVLRVGSANMNNRSMRLDTECDIAIEAGDDEERQAAVARIRNGLLAEHLGCDPADVAGEIERRGSLIAAIERLRTDGRSLVPYEVPEQNAVCDWLADNEVLDPEGPNEMFEPLTKRGLFRRLRKPK